MARDIISMEPKEAVCPHCKGKVLIRYSIAVYDGGDAFQFDGLEIAEPKKIHNPVTGRDYPIRPKRR